MLPARTNRTGALGRAIERYRAERRPAPAPAQPTTLQEFGIVHRCAVTGQRFKMMFVRRGDGQYIPAGQVRIETDRAISMNSGITTTTPAMIAYDAIAHWPEKPCPCCGRRLHYLNPHVLCGRCGELVCTGRTHRQEDGRALFTCHDSCGVRDRIVRGPIVSYAVEPDREPSMPVIKVRANGRI